MRARAIAAIGLLIALACSSNARAEPGSESDRIFGGAFWYPKTDQQGEQSVWAGAGYAHALIPRSLSLLVAFGYVAAGERPFRGQHGLAPLIGVELADPSHGRARLFARAMGGLIVRLPSGFTQWTQEQAMASLHLGLRLGGLLELYAAGGFGPGRGLNIGFGVGGILPLDDL